MLRNLSFLRLFHPNGISPMRKTPSVICNYHRIAVDLCPYRVQIPYRQLHRKLTSTEMKNLKNSLVEIEKCKTGRLKKDESTSVQKNHLKEFTSERTSATDEDWDILLRNTLSIPGYLNEFNIDGKIMGFCTFFQNLDLAKSYLGYMKKHGKKFNQAVVIDFIKTCYSCKSILTEVDLKVIRKFTNYLMNNFQVMDVQLSSAAVKGLSILNDWKKCIELVENLEKSQDPGGLTVYSPLILCLFKNQQFELGYKILLENLSKNKSLTDSVFKKWIEICQHDPDRLEQILIVLKDYNVIPKKSVCDYLIEVYSHLPSKHQRKGEYTTIKLNGRCQSCMKKLEKNMLLEDEFNELQDAFLNRVLLGDDLFRNSTPAEVQSFYNIVKAHAPFDVVIDGLNVMYGSGRKTNFDKTSALQSLVDCFFERDKNIFIVGRKHMKKLPKRAMENIMEKSTLFLIDNESKDDPFIIYSSLFSGPKCCFVSNDYYRSEKFRLKNDRLSDLFKRWQLSHQITMPKSLRGSLELPLQFKLSAQKTASQSWHIPYRDDSYTGIDEYEKSDLTKWLCLK